MIENILSEQRAYFDSGATRSYESRIQALKDLKTAVSANLEGINEALKKDLNKSETEAYLSEIGIVLSEAEYAIRNLKKWMRPMKRKTPFPLFLASSRIEPEPLGVVLVMSPWNYPFQLALVPLIGAIAAGNTVVVKPASYAPNTSMVIEKILSSCFKQEFVATVQGGRNENTLLLEQRFDHIFFTGSAVVGRTVLEKASRNLTPSTLELGGKSPCIVGRNVDLELVGKRIAFGKFLNAGQTCVAPDYVFAPKEMVTDLVKAIKKAAIAFFGTDPLQYPDYPKIINSKHLERLLGYLPMGKVAFGGKSNDTSLEPTVLVDVDPSSPVMEEEIFGPILPILPYTDIEEVYGFIRRRPKPLALYLFTNDRALEKKTFETLSFGGATVNDTVMHFASTEIGFGGVGNSGFGRYHGKFSFDTFSNPRSILKRSNLVDLPFRYHPYTEKKFGLLKRFLK